MRESQIVNALVASKVQVMFDKAQESVLDSIRADIAALEQQDFKPPHIDGLPNRYRGASAIGGAIADTARQARDAKAGVIRNFVLR